MNFYSPKYKVFYFIVSALLIIYLITYFFKPFSSTRLFWPVYCCSGIQQALISFNFYKLDEKGKSIFHICFAIFFIGFSVCAAQT